MKNMPNPLRVTAHCQMYNSLRHIRNSATKKQLSKIFDYEKTKYLDQQESVTALTTDEWEMGVKASQGRSVLLTVCVFSCPL